MLHDRVGWDRRGACRAAPGREWQGGRAMSGEHRRPCLRGRPKCLSAVGGGAVGDADLPRRLSPWHRAALGVLCGIVLGHASPGEAFWDGLWGVDCSRWNSADFFAHATVDDVKGCLDDGIDPAARDDDGSTPLFWAIAHAKDASIVEAFLEAGADPMARAAEDLTPLHMAAMHAMDSAIVTLLTKAGADPMARAAEDLTPLHMAAMHAKEPVIVTLLIKAGADPMARDAEDLTPLHMAAMHAKRPAIVTTLINSGADPWRELSTIQPASHRSGGTRPGYCRWTHRCRCRSHGA